MYIILTDMANITPYVIPVVPPDVSVDSNGKSDSTDTLSGMINVINNPDLREVSWSSFFPVNKDYSFVPSASIRNGWLYVAFLELMKTYRLPIRIIITTKSKAPVLNMLASIENLKYSLDTSGDIQYSIKLKEFPEGFFGFINRDKDLFNNVKKYISGYLKSSNKKEKLKEYKLLIKKSVPRL